MSIKNRIGFVIAGGIWLTLVSCKAKDDFPGLEYAPQMYHSVGYEPLSQITDKKQGAWLSSLDDGMGEFYNSNPNNPHGMTMREPVAGTVKRSYNGMLPYRIHPDSIDYAADVLENPIQVSEQVLADGKVAYERFCSACHGKNGKADGKVAEPYKGVPAYNVGRVADLNEGHIFHTITHGKGRMKGHGSQIALEDRWKIVHYVQKLQKEKDE